MTKLIGVGELLKNTWKIYREKFTLVVGLMVLPFLLMSLTQILMGSTSGLALTLGFIISLAACLGIMWGGAGVLMALRDRSQVMTIKEAYAQSWNKLLPLIWVAILTMFIVGGGYMLLIIPGIILTVWVLFAQIAVVVEGEKGLRAIVKSREYTRDYFWPILGRYIVMAIAMTIVYLVLMAVSGFVSALFIPLGNTAFMSVLNLLGSIVNILILPLGVIYTYLVYENVKQVKGEILVDSTKKQGLVYLLVGFLGWLLIVIISVFFMSLLATLLMGLFVGQSLNGLNTTAREGLTAASTSAPFEVPAGLTAEQQEQLKAQMESLKSLKSQIEQMKGNLPTNTTVE